MSTPEAKKPPKEDIYRSLYPGVETRASEGSEMPTLFGHFSVFNSWTHIRSAREGEFMERIAPGAFTKTFAEGRADMRILFQHGRDPQIGDKPLGPIADLREDDIGAYYEVPLLDTSYNRDLVPGLKAGVYGASFRFQAMREDFNTDAVRSATNPDALPERTIHEARVLEAGPVTFGAYGGATSGVRSVTDMICDADDFLIVAALSDERIAAVAAVAAMDEERISAVTAWIKRDITEPAETDVDEPAEEVVDDEPVADESEEPKRTAGELFGLRRSKPAWMIEPEKQKEPSTFVRI